MDIFKSCRIVERSEHGVPEVVKVYGKSAYRFSTNTITVTIPFDKTGFNQYGKINCTVNCTVNEAKILNLINENNKVTVNEITSKVNLSRRTVQTIINSLKSKGILVRVGSDKTGHWEIVEEKKED